MKTSETVLIGVLASLAVLQAVPVLAIAAATAGETPETRSFVGEYNWSYQDQPGPLRAGFTPTGDKRWDVAFHFRFDGRNRTYLGTARGSLSGGEIEGKVHNENQRRSFTFEAEFEEGRLLGTHAETTPSRARRTGTLTLTEDA